MTQPRHNLAPFERRFAGKRVLVTGHTGFSGGWLCLWLSKLGAHVSGLSLPPITQPNMFEALDVTAFTQSHIADINDARAVNAVFNAARPEIIFHLAAQPPSSAKPTATRLRALPPMLWARPMYWRQAVIRTASKPLSA